MALHTETRATTDEDGRGIGASPRLSGSAAIAPSRVRERETGGGSDEKRLDICLTSLPFFSSFLFQKDAEQSNGRHRKIDFCRRPLVTAG